METTLVDQGTENDQFLRGLDQVDLSMLRLKLSDHEDGAGWSPEHCDRVDREYRRYLALAREYVPAAVVPSKIVDTFWHYHILDTAAYAEDCESVFGYFLHHFPYFGMRGTDDMRAPGDAYEETLCLYERHFGPAPADIWVRTGGMARCPKCGRVS